MNININEMYLVYIESEFIYNDKLINKTSDKLKINGKELHKIIGEDFMNNELIEFVVSPYEMHFEFYNEELKQYCHRQYVIKVLEGDENEG